MAKNLKNYLAILGPVFSGRFLAAGALNFLFSNLVFTVLWLNIGSLTNYWLLMVISSFTSITFSLFLHKKITFKGQLLRRQASPLFYLFHSLVFLLTIVAVPKISQLTGFNLLLIQYSWVFTTSALGVLLLHSHRKIVAKR